ncbi:HepT-like ribonuclease domain-containing protein [Actinomyces sp. oral taxon 170]
MRHVLVHQYFDINVSVVLDVVDQELTPFEEALIKARRAEGGSPN